MTIGQGVRVSIVGAELDQGSVTNTVKPLLDAQTAEILNGIPQAQSNAASFAQVRQDIANIAIPPPVSLAQVNSKLDAILAGLGVVTPPPVIPPLTASPENTRGVRVVADDLAVWTLDSANNTLRNGVAVGGGIAIGYLKLNGIYCYAGNMYFQWTGTAWAAPVGDPSVPPNLMPTIGLTTSVLVATDPGSVLISTTPADPDGTVTKVELFDNGGLIATLTQTPYTYTHMNVSAGPHSYTGKVYDNSTGTAISAASLVTINAVVVPPTIVDPIPVQII